MTARQRQFKWLFTTLFCVLVFDQITKSIVLASIEVDPGYRENTFFYFTHQRNEGLVGGMFSGYPYVTLIAPIVATLTLIYLFRHLNPASRLQSLAFGMVMGGALGNLTDRIRLGSVTDFLQFHFYFIPFDFYWKFYPAFNIADSAIVVGVFVLVLSWNTTQPAQSDAPGTV